MSKGIKGRQIADESLEGVDVKDKSLTLSDINANYRATYKDTVENTSSTSWDNYHSFTFDIEAQGDYVLHYTVLAQFQNTKNGRYMEVRLGVGGNNLFQPLVLTMNDRSVSNVTPLTGFYPFTISAPATFTVTVDYRTSNGGSPASLYLASLYVTRVD